MKASTLFLILIFILSSKVNFAQDYVEIENQIQTIWDNQKQKFINDINQKLAVNNTEILYNVQLETFNLLIYAHHQKKYELMDELIGVYLEAFKHIQYKTENKIITSIGENEATDVYCTSLFSQARPMWVVNYNKQINDGETLIRTITFEHEHLLNSANFLQMISRAILYATQVPENERGANINNLLSEGIINIVVDHYNRWLNEDITSQGQGWGCDPKSSSNCFTIRDFLQKIIHSNWINTIENKKHCNAIRGEIMSIIGGVSDILASNKLDSNEVSLTTIVKDSFVDFIQESSSLIESRLSETPNNGLVLDAGYWKDHYDYKYSGNQNEISCALDLVENVNQQTTVDLSHARKWVHVFESLHLNRSAVDLSFPDIEIMKKFSNQFAYNVYNGDTKFPLFTNYFDGSNGWHRVNYKSKDDNQGDGHAPYFYSVAAYEGGFTFWSTYNSDIENIRNSLWNMINAYSTDFEVKNHVDKYYDNWYAKCDSLVEYRDFDNPNMSKDLLQFLPTFFSRKLDAELQKKNFVVRDAEGHLYLYPFGDVNHSFFNNNGGSKVGNDWDFTHYFANNWTGDNKTDLLVRDAQGDLYLYWLNASNSFFEGNVKVGNDWLYSDYFPGDWTGDGKTDLLVKDAQGDLYLYWLNSSNSFFEGNIKVGNDWSYTDYLPGDWTGDGKTDLLVKDAQGDLYLYWLNSSNSFFTGNVKVGNDWPYTDYLPGDWTGDGKTDLLVRDAQGDLYLYWLNSSNSFFEGNIKVGNDWSYANYYPGDWTSDGKTDLLVRDAQGDLYLYWLNSSNSFFEGNIKVGNNWQYTDYLIFEKTDPPTVKADTNKLLTGAKNMMETLVFPNPNKGDFFLHSRSSASSIEIYDIYGKSINYKRDGNYFRLDKANIDGSMVFIKIHQSNNIQIKKVIIED